MDVTPSFVCFKISNQTIMDDYYGSTNIGFLLPVPAVGTLLDLEVNGFHLSSRSSANSIYDVCFQSVPRDDLAQSNYRFFPSMNAGDVGFNVLVWNVRGLRIGDSSSTLRELISKWNLSIVVLTETRVPNDASSRSLIGSFGLPFWREVAFTLGLLCNTDFVVFLCIP
ncbi:uncharacterized protein G2W53_025375 [Senna tora]|uniref:Endonuclease/exonuclease/phosphatase domain-containing protein n=1 Tax=Senna tora TaxID=362788 RepID=A0A834WE49_9FABA|nr:uncharacterized protein G2W53_025375 [Senna tora]